MENVPIYDDEKMSIEISGDFQCLLEEFYSPAIMISIAKEDFYFLTNIAFTKIEQYGIKIHKPVVSSTMPLIEIGKQIGLFPPYERLGVCFNLLANYIYDIFLNRDELQMIMSEKLKPLNSFCYIFEYPIRNAAGFVYLELNENEAILMFFSHIDCLL